MNEKIELQKVQSNKLIFLGVAFFLLGLVVGCSSQCLPIHEWDYQATLKVFLTKYF